MPDKCPVCGTPVQREPGVAKRYCTNAACPAQLKERMHHFVGRPAMDIEGLGEKLADRFVDLGWVHDASDIYHLDWEQVATLEGFGEKSAENLKASIERSKAQPLWRLLNGLGIRHVGERTAALIAARFGSFEALFAATETEIEEIAGIGSIVAKSVFDFAQEPKNRQLVERLTTAGLTVREERTGTAKSRPLDGLTLVITGRLDTMTRPEAEGRLRQAGANVTSSVSKKTSAVIAGADAGSKAVKAISLKVPLLTEDDLHVLLAGELPTVLMKSGE